MENTGLLFWVGQYKRNEYGIIASMMNKIKTLLFYALPIVVMIGLIPFIQNEYLLAAIYALCIVALLGIKSEKNDLLFLVFGFVVMTISESLFVSTGVATFARHSLFGLMPFWLPFLWAYVFVTLKRSIRILDN